MTTTHTTHKKIATQVAERLGQLREVDPDLYELLNTYVTSLRFENSRYRHRLRNLQNGQSAKEGSDDR